MRLHQFRFTIELNLNQLKSTLERIRKFALQMRPVYFCKYTITSFFNVPNIFANEHNYAVLIEFEFSFGRKIKSIAN